MTVSILISLGSLMEKTSCTPRLRLASAAVKIKKIKAKSTLCVVIPRESKQNRCFGQTIDKIHAKSILLKKESRKLM